MNEIKIGWAHENITPERPVWMIGQMYHRVSEYVRDPITATALALDNGESHLMFVSLDMTEVPLHALQPLKERLGDLNGLNFENISFGVTHTHNSTDFNEDFLRIDSENILGSDVLPELDFPDDILCGEEAQTYFVDKLIRLITNAWESRKPGGISTAHDYAAVGFSRRAVFAHGDAEETIMYGDCSDDRFLRFEPGGDNAVEILYTWGMDGALTGVAINVPCPSQVFELHRFLSADYWGFVRRDVVKTFGDVFVLPLCGAAGDLCPIDLVDISKNNKDELQVWAGQSDEVYRNIDMDEICEGISARVNGAVMRGYQKAKQKIDFNPVFTHEILNLELPLRMVSEEDYLAALKEVERIHSTFSKEHRMSNTDIVRAFETQGDILRWKLQQDSKYFPCKVHVVRIGKISMATNPFELFSEFAQRMKARAKSEQLFVIQMSNGIGGYLPSQAAISGGSYSSKPASTLCGPEGGDQLVEQTLDAIIRMFAD